METALYIGTAILTIAWSVWTYLTWSDRSRLEDYTGKRFYLIASPSGYFLLLALAGWWREVLGLPSVMGSVGVGCGALFYGFAAAALWAPVFRSRRITEDTLVGTLCIYLLACLSFASAYLLAWELAPAAFSFASGASESRTFADFVYFSFVTATTLGYGDMTPQQPIARLLTSFEAMIGPIYLAIMVARLVGMHISQSLKPSKRS